MIRKITLIVALFAALTITELTAQVQFHTGDTSELYKASRNSDKLIFVDLYASWCPPCKMMDSNVFSRKDVGDFMAKNFISAKYSVDETIGSEFSRTYSVRSIPTYLIFNKDGELVARMTGGMSHTEFISQMSDILKKAGK